MTDANDLDLQNLDPNANDPDLRCVNRALLELRKQFDTVQVFAMRHERDELGTTRVNKGSGNYFARYGLVRLWCNAQILE